MERPIHYGLLGVCALMLVGMALALPAPASASVVCHGSWEVHQDEWDPSATDLHFTIWQKERWIEIDSADVTVTIVGDCPGYVPFATSSFTFHDNGEGDGKDHAVDCVFDNGVVPFCCTVRIDATLYLTSGNTVRIKDIVWTLADDPIDDDLPDNGWMACKPGYTLPLKWKFFNDSPDTLTLYSLQFYTDGTEYLGPEGLASWDTWNVNDLQDTEIGVTAGTNFLVFVNGFELEAYLYFRVGIYVNGDTLEIRGEHQGDTHPTQVDLASFDAVGRDGLVNLQWVTATELGNAGFNVHRSLSENGDRLLLSGQLISSRGDELQGGIYNYTDRTARAGLTYYYWLEDVNYDGMSTWHGPVSAQVAGSDSKPMRLSLAQNNPNPFKGTTEIQYGLPAECAVNLTVYDLAGREVRALVAEQQPSGYHLVQWDGRNNAGLAVPGGLYFYRLNAGGQEEMRTIVYLR